MIIKFLSVLVPLGVLDGLWILVVAKSFYSKHMSFLFSEKVNYFPIYFFYPIYALGILFLVVLPALKSGSLSEALWRGALLGLVSYGAYDLTNQATISGWPTVMTLVDIGWGVLVTSLTSIIAFYLITSIK